MLINQPICIPIMYLSSLAVGCQVCKNFPGTIIVFKPGNQPGILTTSHTLQKEYLFLFDSTINSKIFKITVGHDLGQDWLADNDSEYARCEP